MVIGIIPLVAGIICLVPLVYLIVMRRRAQSWETTNGVVTESEVVSFISTVGHHSQKHKASICYEYDVGGKRFEGSQIGFMNPIFRRRSNAESKAQEFPVGTDVAVCFDPSDPSKAVLNSAVSSAKIIMFAAISVVLITLGLLLAAGVFSF